MATGAVVLALAAVALVGCAARQPDPTRAEALSEPAAVTNRSALPVCGIEKAGQGGPWNDTGRACFWKAYQDRRPAEFISTRPTTEGDPITTIYRVLPGGAVEIFIDSTQDKFGDGRWDRLACRTLAAFENGSVANDFGPDDSCVATPLP